MKELQFLEHWINEHYLNKRFSIRPIQRCFSNDDKNYQNNVIYFGCFSGDVIVHSPFQIQPLNLKDTHSRYFIFSHLGEASNVDHTFIGYEITFLDLFIQHEVLPPVDNSEIFLPNLIYIRLGGCEVTESNLFTMYHRNGYIYEDIECLLPFNGVNEVYSFSYDLQHFYSCNINSLGQITNYLTCEVVLDPPEEPVILPVSYWQAIHPYEHNGDDTVTYIDEYGEQQTDYLIRREDPSENPCTLIQGFVVSHHGVVPCDFTEIIELERVYDGRIYSDFSGLSTIQMFTIFCYNELNELVYSLDLVNYNNEHLPIASPMNCILRKTSDLTIVSNYVIAEDAGGF